MPLPIGAPAQKNEGVGVKNSNQLQQRALKAVTAQLPIDIDGSNVIVEDGLSYTRSPIKAHDYATGLFSAFGGAVEYLGRMRGLPAQTLTVNRRLSGLSLNSLQLTFSNGRALGFDDYTTGPDNGIYRTRDNRFFGMIGLHPKLRDGITEYLGATSREGLRRAISQRDAQDLEDSFAQRRLPGGIVRTPQEWLDHPQGRACAEHPMVLVDQLSKGGSHRRLGNATLRPLEGVRVVELANVVAGPTTGRALAEQGAEVIKLACVGGPVTIGIWLDANWGKRQFRMNIKGPAGQAKLRELLAGADVLLNSMSPGRLTELGLGPEALQQINPNLILADFSFAPKNSPWFDRKGFEQIAQSVSGIVSVNSQDRYVDDPTHISVLINDFCSAYNLATGIVSALAAREEQGGFWYVEHSLLRNATEAVRYVRPMNDERYAPVSIADLRRWAIDQDTPNGVFTRLTPPVTFSHTPSKAWRPTGLPFGGVEGLSWQDKPIGSDDPLATPHYPSRIVAEGRLHDFVECYGIEDRGDGGGDVSFFSPGLAVLSRNQGLEAI